MPKIIIVQGKSNTGKSTAIRAFASQYNFNLHQPGDFTIANTLTKFGTSYQSGIATGGDTASIVDENLQFFIRHNCDLMVCACRTSGGTVATLQRYISANGWTAVWLPIQAPASSIQTVQRIDSSI